MMLCALVCAGSVVYQRFSEYFGVLFEMSMGYLNQGYCTSTYGGYFGDGSLYIPLPRSTLFNPARNCTPGFAINNASIGIDQWYPGNCEADIICQVAFASAAVEHSDCRV